MRLSLLTSACTSAVVTTVLTLPLLAQPAPKNLKLARVANSTKTIQLHCKEGKDLSQCIDGAQGLSPKEKKDLKKMVPKLKQELKQSLGKMEDGSGECFTLRVFEYPKGFPEKTGKVQPKVSDCTSAKLVKEKPLVLRPKMLKH